MNLHGGCHRKGICAGLPALPGDWQESPLGDLVDTNPETLGTGTPGDFAFRYIDLSSVTEGVINWETVHETNYRAAPSRARRCVRQHDVLFGTVRPSLQSHTAIGPVDGGPLVASTGFAVLRAGTKSCSDYIKHLIFSDAMAIQVRRLETGSNYPAVNESDLKRVLVPHPEEAEQARIAEVLDTLDEAIMCGEELVGKLAHAGEGLLHDLVTRGLDHKGEAQANRSQHPFPPLIPESWTLERVEEVGSVVLGRQRAPKYEKGPNIRPYLRVANVFDGWIDFSDILSMNFSPAEQVQYQLLAGDILLNEGQSLELVGRSAMYEGEPGAFCFQNTLVRFRCLPQKMIPVFARMIFKYWLDTGRFMTIAKQTTSVAHLGADRFAKMRIPVPPLEEQAAIAARFQSFTDRLKKEKENVAKLRLLKSGLSSDLLTGQVRTR